LVVDAGVDGRRPTVVVVGATVVVVGSTAVGTVATAGVAGTAPGDVLALPHDDATSASIAVPNATPIETADALGWDRPILFSDRSQLGAGRESHACVPT